MDIRIQLEKRKDDLERYKKNIIKNRQSEPEGKIRIIRRGNRSEFFSVPPKINSGAKYISVSEKGRISAYLQKRYDHSVEKDIDKQITAISIFLKTYSEECIKNRYYQIHDLCREYVKALELPDEIYAENWQKKKYVGNTFTLSNDFITAKGERVRSKSEIIIANCLKEFNVPYRYEHPLYFSSAYKIYPDFTVLNTKTRQEIYWEHFGRMDNDEYRTKAFEKLNMYSSFGIVPGNGLIITFEDYRNPLSVSLVQETIKKVILQE